MELMVTTFVTMDGVMQGPGSADEDTSNGCDQGGWVVPFADQDFGEIVDAWIARADEILLGRTTYELMFPYWSQMTDPDEVVARQLNNLPKHIVSRTLRSPEWANSSVIDGDVVEAVKALKDRPGGELQGTVARCWSRR
jgi:dihydrofolate reductase